MRPAARISSINALKEFKRSLGSFGTVAINALDEAQADVQRTVWWIQNDQLAHWQNLKKKRAARLAQAKSELFRAEVASPDQRVPATAERKAVDKAERDLDEAETKIANVKRWSRLLEREMIIYKGHCQQLARSVEGDLPVAVVRLQRMIEALEKYVTLAVPAAEHERLAAESPGDSPAEPRDQAS